MNVTVSFEVEGLLGYKGRDQMLESTHNLSSGFGIKKIRANDYYLFKRKLPGINNLGITKPTKNNKKKTFRC